MQMKPSELALFLETSLTPETPLLITGAPGIGKSDIVTQAAQAMDADLLISHPVVSDPTDYKGMPAIIPGPAHEEPRAEFLPFGDLRRLLTADRPLIAFLDDLGQAPPAVQAAVMQLLLARRINGHLIGDGVMFVAATNRKQDRAGVSGILEPVKSRFASIIELIVDVDDWQTWALDAGITFETIQFIRMRPDLLYKFEPSTELKNGPSPRTWAKLDALHRQIEQARIDRPDRAGDLMRIEPAAYAGAVGEGAAAEYTGFLRIYRNLPDPDAVLMNPATAPVPDDPSTLYALTGALAHRVTNGNAARFFEYADRLPEEFNVRMVKDAIARKPNDLIGRPYIEWTQKHKEAMT